MVQERESRSLTGKVRCSSSIAFGYRASGSGSIMFYLFGFLTMFDNVALLEEDLM